MHTQRQAGRKSELGRREQCQCPDGMCRTTTMRLMRMTSTRLISTSTALRGIALGQFEAARLTSSIRMWWLAYHKPSPTPCEHKPPVGEEDDMSVIEFTKSASGKVELGPELSGHSVIVDGRLVPRLRAYDRGNTIDFILDGRFSYEVPTELSDLFASAIGNAMAIGAGWPCLAADQQAPFAPRVFEL